MMDLIARSRLDLARLREAILCDPEGLAPIARYVRCVHRLSMTTDVPPGCGRLCPRCRPADGYRLDLDAARELLDSLRDRVARHPETFIPARVAGDIGSALRCDHFYGLTDSCPNC